MDEKFFKIDLEWECDICKLKRPDQFISVQKNLINWIPSGAIKPLSESFEERVKYCNDSSECASKAKNYSRFQNVTILPTSAKW